MFTSLGNTVALILPVALANLIPLPWWTVPNAAKSPAPLKALVLAGGGSADCKTLVPILTNGLTARVNITFDLDFTLDRLTNKNFADAYDVVIYDFGFDSADPGAVSNAVSAIRNGKPAVIIDCAVRAFAGTKSLAQEWENAVGTKAARQDQAAELRTARVDANSPILTGWPDDWKVDGTAANETGELSPNAHPLLSANSPGDTRARAVCWTQTYGQGHVFATTLGHDAAAMHDPAYLGLVARGLLWSCDKLRPDGKATDGYGKEYSADK